MSIHKEKIIQIFAYVLVVGIAVIGVLHIENKATKVLHQSQLAACTRGNNLRRELNRRTDHIDAIANNLNILTAALSKNGTLPKQTVLFVIRQDNSEQLPQFTIIDCHKEFPNP